MALWRHSRWNARCSGLIERFGNIHQCGAVAGSLQGDMDSDAEYLLRRSEEEQEAAGRTENAKARQLHIELAARYRDAANGAQPPRSPEGPAGPGLPGDFRILE